MTLLDQDKLQYNYAWTYNEKPQSEIEEKDVSEDLMKAMGKVVTLENFVPQYQNQAIIFTGDDMGSDKAMMVMLLYIIIVIMHLYLASQPAIRSPKRPVSSEHSGHPVIPEASWPSII